MKILLTLLVALFLTNQYSMANQDQYLDLICKGPAKLIFIMAPVPLSRDVELTIVETADSVGTITISAGGEPVEYTGLLILDGSEKMVSINQNNGDILKIQIDLKKMKMKLGMSFYSDGDKYQGGIIGKAKLTCENL